MYCSNRVRQAINSSYQPYQMIQQNSHYSRINEHNARVLNFNNLPSDKSMITPLASYLSQCNLRLVSNPSAPVIPVKSLTKQIVQKNPNINPLILLIIGSILLFIKNKASKVEANELSSEEVAEAKVHDIEEEHLKQQFHEFSRRAPKALAKLAEFSHEELKAGVHGIIEAAELKEWWTHDIFKNKNYPYYALQSVKEGHLSIEGFSNIMTLWAVINDKWKDEITVYPIPLEDPKAKGQANPVLVEQISNQTMHGKPSQKERGYSTTIPQEKVKAAIESVIQKKDPFVQHLFLLETDRNEYDTRESIIYQFRENLGMGLMFDEFKSPYDHCTVLPSPAIYEQLLKLLFPCPSIPNPVIGKSSIKDIEDNAYAHQRDMAIPFPEYCYTKIDGTTKNHWIDMTIHDWYHALRASIMGQHTAAFQDIATIIRKKIPKRYESKKYDYFMTSTLAWIFTDMEGDPFKRFKYEDPSDLFWKLFSNKIKDRSDNLELTFKTLEEAGFFRALVADIAENKDYWEKEFGVNLESVKKLNDKNWNSLKDKKKPLVYVQEAIDERKWVEEYSNFLKDIESE